MVLARLVIQRVSRPLGLTPDRERVVAGLLHDLPALLPVACALEVSYRRLVPAAEDGVAAHLELKVADHSANPYLLVGAVAAAVRESLNNPRPLAPPVKGDPIKANPPPPRLPQNLGEAVAELEASAMLREAMGELLHRTLVESRQAVMRRSAGLEASDLIASTRWW
jgi:glutamine synthetase